MDENSLINKNRENLPLFIQIIGADPIIMQRGEVAFENKYVIMSKYSSNNSIIEYLHKPISKL